LFCIFANKPSFGGLVLHFCQQTENVVRLRRLRAGGGGTLQLPLGGRKIRHIEQRNAEIDARQRQCGIELQRTFEGVRGLFMLVLFEQRDADVIGAICVFARGRFGWRVLTNGGALVY
jgi:hypothetical protein